MFLANEETDHSIEDKHLTLIWAMGQTLDMYNHLPISGLEKCTAHDKRLVD